MQNQGPVQVHSHVSQDSSFSKVYESKSNTKTVEKLPPHLKPSSKQVASTLPSTLNNKIEVLGKPIASLDRERDNDNLNLLPSRFHHDMNDSYIVGIKTKQAHYLQLIEKDPNHCNLRLQYAENSLLFAEIFDDLLREEKEAEDTEEQAVKLLTEKLNSALDIAKIENQQAKLLNTLHPRHYYIESMIMEFEGVNCRDLEQVEKYVMLLKVSLALDPTSTEVKQTLDEAVAFLKSRWTELLQEDTIDDATHSEWTKKLNEWLSNDALKVLFANNPKLFKLASQAQHTEFFKKHPELKSVEAFLTKYPQLGSIHLPQKLNKDNVSEILAKEEDNPLATQVPLISQTAILTPVVVNEIKKAMLNYSSKQKILKIYVGNEDDVNVIANSFKNDPSLSKTTGALSRAVLKMEGYSFFIYAVYINPSKPFVRI